MSPLQGLALAAQATFTAGCLRVIADRRTRRQRPALPPTPSAISGACPTCGGTIALPVSARWTTPCDGCGLRFVGVLDPAHSGTELLWLPVQAHPAG